MRLKIYGKLCTQVYDITKPQVPEDALEFYLRHLEYAVEPVLEPMCGSGRFLIPFLELGIDIDGADASPDMLKACREHCKRKGLRAMLYKQFLQELSLPRQYGFIFIPAASFGLIVDRQAVKDSLKRLYDHLLPNGKLVLEVETPRAQPKTPGKWGVLWVTRPDGAKIVLSSLPTYDSEEHVRRDIHKYELFQNEHLVETQLEDFALRFYERDDFEQLLKVSGFRNIRATKVYGDTEPDIEETTIAFECKKS
jgi:ubiquinone/menaquinone biosynthesis C-methylase UbiE